MKNFKRVFIPGNDWMYLKLYTGIKIADWIISCKLYCLMNKLKKENLIVKFFFIRYSDPDYHIRLRILLSDNVYFENVVDSLNHTLKMVVEKELVWKIQLDTYQREIERYNSCLMEYAESIFYIDSVYVIKIIRCLEYFDDEEYRWKISLLLIDSILSDFNFDIRDKKDLMLSLSVRFKEKYGFNKSNSKQFNDKYRQYKSVVKSVIDNYNIDNKSIKLVNFVYMRSKDMKSIINDMQRIAKLNKINLRDYVGSYIHMTMNRLFRSDNNLYELIIYDFMQRYYMSKMIIDNIKNK